MILSEYNYMKKVLIITALVFNSIISMAQIDWRVNPVGAVFAREGGATPDGTFRLTSGGYEVYTIAGAGKSFQPAALFYGKDEADREKVDAMVPDGKVPAGMNCFVVNTPEGYIMFDTGLPASKGGCTVERLASLKIAPEQITAIYLTHGHFDHIGGLLDDSNNAVYPNAKVYVPSAEYETMGEFGRQIEKAYSGRTIIFDEGEILPCNVLPVSAKGHTPGHTAYQLGSLLFVGDIMHGTAIQLIDPTICASFDADREQAITTRNSILAYAAANSLTVLCAHAPLNGIIF